MPKLPLAFLIGFGGLTLAAIATSETLIPALNRADIQRPTDQIAADLGLPEAAFIACFAGVRPDQRHTPSDARQQANKAVLLPCLQATNPAIDNGFLDRVMDRYRPEAPILR